MELIDNHQNLYDLVFPEDFRDLLDSYVEEDGEIADSIDEIEFLNPKDTIEVIDFKTDVVKSSSDLVVRYLEQMMSYQAAVAQVFEVGVSMVECRIVSTSFAEVIDVNGGDIQGELDL